MMFKDARNTVVKFLARPGKNNNFLAVEINSKHGIGAKLLWLLEILAYCEENNLAPKFRFTYPDPDSVNNEDYFSEFFGIKNSSDKDDAGQYIKIKNIGELGLSKSYNDVLTIDLAYYLINKYLVIKDDVLHEVNAFCTKNFNDKKVLGVHYRGTDKSLEAPNVPYDKVKRNIIYYLDRFPETDVVFISSDDNNFIEYIKDSSVGRPVIYRNDSFRSVDNTAIHHSGQNVSDINRDAIINCLILSRSDALMKTVSILSAWSKIFNPQLPLIMLNKPFQNCIWFPERDLIDNVVYDEIP